MRLNFAIWIREKERSGVTFSNEKREWLERMRDHVATSLAIQPADFETGWFGQHGSLGRAHTLFGHQLATLIEELNARLAA